MVGFVAGSSPIQNGGAYLITDRTIDLCRQGGFNIRLVPLSSGREVTQVVSRSSSDIDIIIYGKCLHWLFCAGQASAQCYGCSLAPLCRISSHYRFPDMLTFPRPSSDVLWAIALARSDIGGIATEKSVDSTHSSVCSLNVRPYSASGQSFGFFLNLVSILPSRLLANLCSMDGVE